MVKWIAIPALLSVALTAAAFEAVCGPGAACKVDGGEYNLSFPANWNGTDALPAVMFFHGHGSKGENVIRNGGLRKAFAKAGYLLIAPTGSNWPGHNALGWPARLESAGRRDDVAFTKTVLDDVARRLPLARDRVLAAGFSSGGSMAWHLGCHAGERFAGVVSVAGGLRRPTPAERCPAGPFKLIHFHGFKDSQVPLEGRGIRDWHQGDVFEGLAILRTTNACRSNPTRFEASGAFQCRVWDDCGSGSGVQFCLHDGGHNLPRGWAARALDWFGLE